ncbi:MAG: hypothetical protein IJP74_05770 [Prevotella sp.]|nr:hypothetical protein [Prevotella sp.]MBR0048811.1 hypothetical protein [Prevotella sp.]
MANKRTLKRAINLICADLFAECVAASLYGPSKNKDNSDAVLFRIIKMQSNFVSRVGHPEPGMKASDYYRDLREKFNAEVDDIIININNLL